VAGEGDVAGAVEQQGAGRGAVAPGAADLLVPALRRARQVGVRHPAHVGPVDPHAEGDGGRHDHRVAAGEAPVRVALAPGVHAGVEAQRVVAVARSHSAVCSVFFAVPQ
jgi:hypothetical protein